MAKDPVQSFEELYRQVYSPLKSFYDLLEELTQGLPLRGTTRFSICLRTLPGTEGLPETLPLVIGGPGLDGPSRDRCAQCLLRSQSTALAPVPSSLPCHPGGLVPIAYQREILGFVAVRESLEFSGPASSVYRAMAVRIAHLAKRAELNHRARTRIGRDLWLIGTSRTLASLDAFWEQASRVNLPCLIVGEPGSGRGEVALAVHLSGPRRDQPFLKIDAATLRESLSLDDLAQLIAPAERGTLFLSCVDQMSLGLQSSLADVLQSGLAFWWQTKGRGQSIDFRIIASTGPSPESSVEAQRLHPRLLSELDFLRATLEPLRQRREDIRPLASYFLQQYGTGFVNGASEEVLEVLESYDWPGDLAELRRVVARLAALAEGPMLTLDDLRCHAPQLIQSVEMGRAGAPTPEMPGSMLDSFLALARCRQSVAKVHAGQVHPALLRTLEYLLENLHDDLPLSRIARRACVSPSHLSFLFKQVLGTSPITFLSMLRIERARALLTTEPALGITEVAGKVGFSDLRHFERTFKRFLGTTPSHFRACH